MNPTVSFAGLGIGMLLLLAFFGGIAALLVFAFRRPAKGRGGLGIAIVLSLFLLVAGGLVFALLTPAVGPIHRSTTISPDGKTKIVRTTTPVQGAVQVEGDSVVVAPSVEYSSKSNTYSVTHYGNSTSRKRFTFPRTILAGLSLAAFLALARVAVDGRKEGGYSPLARIVAVAGFIGLGVLLANTDALF